MQETSEASFPRQPVLGRSTRNMIPERLRQKGGARLAKGRPRARVDPTLPVRMTSCILQRPVTRVISHPGNRVRRRQGEPKLQKPQQLCAFGRLQGLPVQGREEDASPLDLEKALKIIALGQQAGTGADVRRARGRASGQSPCWRDVIPGGLTLSPSFYSREVRPADIQRQAQRVTEARKRLAGALQEADRLAKEAGGLKQP